MPDFISRAQEACASCRSRKQGCDKQRPKCSRCTQKMLDCRYGDISETHVATLSNLPIQIQSHLLVVVRDGCGFDLSPAGESLLLQIAYSNGQKAADGDDHSQFTVSQLVSCIFQTGKVDIDRDVDAYFHGIHLSLPILDRDDVIRTSMAIINNDECEPSASAILLLYLHLLVREPCQHPNHTMQSSLYHALKKLFFYLLSSIDSLSCTLLQCGLLLLAYEICHGMLREAYMTLALCIRAAESLCLDEQQEVAASGTGQATIENKDLLRLSWAAIILLDRTLALSTQDCNLSFSIKTDHQLAAASVRPASEDNLHSADVHSQFYARAQAALSIGEWVQCTADGNHDAVLNAESSLQSLLQRQIASMNGKSFPLCETVAFTLSALVILHASPTLHALDKQTERSRLALQSLSNMVFDSCQAEADLLRTVGWIDSSRACIFGTSCIFGIALHLNDLQQDVHGQLIRLKSSLLELRKRWRIADYYLSHLAANFQL